MTPDEEAIRFATEALEHTSSRIFSEHGAPDFGTLLKLISYTEGAAPAADFTAWSAGFTSALDYVFADAELVQALARWWREAAAAACKGELDQTVADLQTRAGTAIIRAALLARELGGGT